MSTTTVIFLLATVASAMDNLDVAYEWNVLDWEESPPAMRELSNSYNRASKLYNVPYGLEVFGDRIFITIPKFMPTVPASLTYIYKNASSHSPMLRPYPNWEAHNASGDSSPEVISAIRVRTDGCNRLWVIDSGAVGNIQHRLPRILIYDLKKDELLRSFEIPHEQMKINRSEFANIAVEDTDCEDTYAYLADSNTSGLVVYSYKHNESWLWHHNYFHFSPLAGEMNVSGIEFQDWKEGILGLALSSPNTDGYSTLYFHPMISFDEFSISTEILRDKARAESGHSYYEFQHLGTRGPKGQSGASFLDKKTGVLFYALINLNAVACWRTTNPTYTMKSQGRIYMSNTTMVFPNDIKVDTDGNLWVLSNKLPVVFYSKLNDTEINFRIMTAKVADAIEGTACASRLVKDPDIMDRLTPLVNGGKFAQNLKKNPTVSASFKLRVSIAFCVICVTGFLI